MSENKTIHRTIMEQFPVRRNKKQKADFRAWAAAFCEERGWKVTIEEPSAGKQKNIVIGDPDSAAMLFSAHYDTPNNSLLPDLRMPCNMVLPMLWDALLILLLFVFALGCDYAAGLLNASPQIRFLAFVLGFLLLAQLMNLFPNRHNANAGTSGLAVILQMIDTLPQEDRRKCAFILFDQGESMQKGSKNYAKDHSELAYMRILVNLDCVGVGDTYLCAVEDMARRCTGYEQFKRVMTDLLNGKIEFHNGKLCRIKSDHKPFKCGIGVGAFTKKPVIGWYTGRLHTFRDTECSQKNIDRLSEAFNAYLGQLKML